MLWIPTDNGASHQRARACESQNGAAVDERAVPESCDPGEKIPFLERREGKNRPQCPAAELQGHTAKRKVGDGRDRVRRGGPEVVSVADYRPV